MITIKRFVTVATLALAPLSLTTPARADAPETVSPETVSFERDGVAYSYTVTERGNVTVLRGTAEEGATKTPFTLRVRNGHVRGQVGASSISFPLSEVRSGTVDAIIASR
jgi:hypothetical protein